MFLFWSVALVGTGLTYRWFTRVTGASSPEPVMLEHPLATLPLRLGDWSGVDVPIDGRILDVAGTDDYVNRRYVEDGSNESVNFYLGYCSRPAKMLGHRPRVCYPANGWAHEKTRAESVALADGTTLDCLVHSFTRERPLRGALIVLNYYVLRGQHTTDWADFWGPKLRRPNLSRDPAFYVAQIQISCGVIMTSDYGPAEEAVKRFAAAAAPHCDAILPSTALYLREGGGRP